MLNIKRGGIALSDFLSKAVTSLPVDVYGTRVNYNPNVVVVNGRIVIIDVTAVNPAKRSSGANRLASNRKSRYDDDNGTRRDEIQGRRLRLKSRFRSDRLDINSLCRRAITRIRGNTGVRPDGRRRENDGVIGWWWKGGVG